MDLIQLKILSYLLMYGEKRLDELSKVFDLSLSYISKAVNALGKRNLTQRKREKGKMLILPNMDNPLVDKLNKFLLLAGRNKEIIDLMEARSILKVISSFDDGGKTIKELEVITDYCRAMVSRALVKLENAQILKRISSRPSRKYILNSKNPLGVLLRDISRIFFSPILEDIFNSISAEKSVLIFVVYGSYVQDKKDAYSDIDLFVVANTEQDKEEILRKYSYPDIDLNVTSKLGIIRMIKEQPYFVKQLKEGEILKGKDLLEAIL